MYSNCARMWQLHTHIPRMGKGMQRGTRSNIVYWYQGCGDVDDWAKHVLGGLVVPVLYQKIVNLIKEYQ